MLKSIFHAAAVFAVAAMISSCFVHEGEIVVNISSTPSSLSVPAQSPDGVSQLRDTIVLTSNRSWTARIADQLDSSRAVTWAHFIQHNEPCDSLEAFSISNNTFDSQIVLAFENNTSLKPRVCCIEVHSGRGIYTIPVKQEGLVE